MTLAPDVFTYVADLVQRRAGIQLDAGKEYLVESRLLPLAQEAGVARVDQFVRHVRVAERPADVQAVVEALTTNETSFFRDGTPFTLLGEHVVPALRGPDGAAPDRLRVWSAACSTGQEPYSVAMALAECLPPTTAVEIVATDINAAVLERAAHGSYSRLETNRGLPSAMLVRHFDADGTGWRVREHLRRQVTFLRHNLLDQPVFGGQFDVVFLRNVLIYFDADVKRTVLGHVRHALRPGGFLVLGAAETTVGIDDAWERVATERGALYRALAPERPWAPRTAPVPVVAPRTAPVGVVPAPLPRPATPVTAPTLSIPLRGDSR